MSFETIADFMGSLAIETIATIGLALVAAVSGIWLFILKKTKRKNHEKEEAYQKELASEYREEWLKEQKDAEN